MIANTKQSTILSSEKMVSALLVNILTNGKQLASKVKLSEKSLPLAFSVSVK